MGGFYGNITLKGPSQAEVAEALRGRRALVTPKLDDYLVVFDAVLDEQDIEGTLALASSLSQAFRCPALGVLIHDDDVLLYVLYLDGELADWYNSMTPASGNAPQLCAALGSSKSVAVEEILRRPAGRNGYVFESERHRDLVSALSLPGCSVITALASFDRGEYPDGMTEDSVSRAADPPPVEDRKQKMAREFYAALGPEDAARRCANDGCPRGVIKHSVLCRRHHFEMIEGRDCPFED